jgi:hypothetical protein
MATGDHSAGDLDIGYFMSGGTGNTDQTLSLGGPISTQEIITDTPNNIWSDITGPEASSGRTTYRCFYIKNKNKTGDRMENVKVYLSQNTQTPDSTIYIGVGTAATNQTEQTVKEQAASPSGVNFRQPSSPAESLFLGRLMPGDFHSLWLKRVIKTNAHPMTNDFYIVRTEAEAPVTVVTTPAPAPSIAPPIPIPGPAPPITPPVPGDSD